MNLLYQKYSRCSFFNVLISVHFQVRRHLYYVKSEILVILLLGIVMTQLLMVRVMQAALMMWIISLRNVQAVVMKK